MSRITLDQIVNDVPEVVKDENPNLLFDPRSLVNESYWIGISHPSEDEVSAVVSVHQDNGQFWIIGHIKNKLGYQFDKKVEDINEVKILIREAFQSVVESQF